MHKLPILFAFVGWLPFIALSQTNGAWNVMTIVVGAVLAVSVYMAVSELLKLRQQLNERREQETVRMQEAIASWTQQLDKQLEDQQQQMLDAVSSLARSVDTVGLRLEQQTQAFVKIEEVAEQLRSLRDVSETLEKSHQAWVAASQQDRANIEKQTSVLMDTLVQTTESKHAVRERLVQLQERMLKKLVK